MKDNNPRRIFLVGLPGCGKTTIGRMLGLELGIPFYDLDELIEEETGMSIPDLFGSSGEHYFREKESFCLRKILITAPGSFILSTGGGAPAWNGNMEWMNSHGITIYLNTPQPIIAGRISLDKKNIRPLFGSNDKKIISTRLAEMSEKRSAYYNKAQFITDGRTSEETIENILSFIKN